MRKALVPFLVFGLLLLGVTPVMAAGEQVKAAVPVQQDEVVQVVVPEGVQVSDIDLASTEGKGLCTVAAAAFGVGVGAFLSFGAWALGHDPKSALQAAYEAVATSIVSTAAGSMAAAFCTVF